MSVYFKNGLIPCLVLLACVACGQDDEPAVVRRKPSEMPKVATSANGFVKVVAADVPGDPMGFRLPILQFATRNLHELERAYALEMPRRDVPGLVIYAQDGRTNDTRVIAREARRGDVLLTRVWLPSPGFSDLDQLRFEIARAYLRAWIDRAAPRGVTAGELPDWVAQGALRAADAQTVHDDVRFVLGLWSAARLPYFPALCSDLRVAKGPAAYVVAYMRERHLFKEVLERLASGKPWDGAWLAERLTGEREPSEQDRMSDERLARLSRAVLSPGEASAWDVQTFASRLRLYPATFADRASGASCSFAEAVDRAATDESVRLAAAQKAREMPMYVVAYMRERHLFKEVLERLASAAGEAYRKFLLAVARGEPPADSKKLLREADALLAPLLAE